MERLDEETEPPTQREQLVIAGRGFTPGQDVILLCREFKSLKIPARADQTGQFVITLPLPQSFPYGAFTLEANGAGVKLTSSEFYKSFSDKELYKRDRAIDRRQQQR